MYFWNKSKKVRKNLCRWLTISRKRIFTPKFHVRLCFSVVFHLDSQTLSHIYGYRFLCIKVTCTFLTPKIVFSEKDWYKTVENTFQHYTQNNIISKIETNKILDIHWITNNRSGKPITKPVWKQLLYLYYLFD